MFVHFSPSLKKSLFAASCLILFALPGALPCPAAEYPGRAVDVVVPFAPGGGADNFFRAFRGALAKELNVPTNIVNRAGGGGVVGTSFVVNAKADGYTLAGFELLTYLTPQIITPKTVPYQVLKDLKPIAHLAYEPLMLVVRADLEAKTLEDFLAYARKNPGKLLAATSGLGSQNRVDLELLKVATGTQIRFVSFASGGEAMTNLLGGHVDLICGATVTASRSHLKAGKVRALAVFTPERLAEFPDVPTTREKGLATVNLNMTYGLLGPKGLAPEVVERVSQATKAALTAEDTVANLKKLGYYVEFSTPGQLEERLKKDFGLLTEVAKRAGLIPSPDNLKVTGKQDK